MTLKIWFLLIKYGSRKSYHRYVNNTIFKILVKGIKYFNDLFSSAHSVLAVFLIKNRMYRNEHAEISGYFSSLNQGN